MDHHLSNNQEAMEKNEKDVVVPQVSIAGFDRNITALDLTDFIENEIGGVWRCRLKTSWTPLGSYPDFNITNVEAVQIKDDYEKVVPHAFVHFISHEARMAAHNAAGRSELFLNHRPLKVSLGPESPFHINQRRRKILPFKIPARVEIGSLVSPTEFLVGWKAPTSGVNFLVDPFNATCMIQFSKDTPFAFEGTSSHAVINCNFNVEFLVRNINYFRQYTDTYSKVILLQLDSSPHLYYRTADDDIHNTVSFDLMDDEDPWIRTTDFTPSRVISRCSSYRISVPACFGLRLEAAVNYLREQRVQEHPRQRLKIRDEPNFEMHISNHFFCVQDKEGISFEIMFLVNAVIHKGIINHQLLSDEFFELLRGQPREVNVTALTHMYSYRDPVFNPCKRLKDVQEWLKKNPELLMSSRVSDDNVEVRRIVITPTKAYCLPPEVERSNRVLRKYKEKADRFLRVAFMDEGFQQLNSSVLSHSIAPIVRDTTSKFYKQKTTVYQRIKSIMNEGFYLCGRKYSFLAYSANQLRDCSAWFFAEDKKVRVKDIKKWMGKFNDRNVAKCAARMGQCFSSTYATVDVPLQKVNMSFPDIERNGYVFSDGIGIIIPQLAAEVAEKLNLTVNAPSAYQIRYAGCKGVVTCWPRKDDGILLFLSKSMNKFESTHTILEVISWTRFQPGFLNRQIITLLSALGVPDHMFSRMQDTMISNLNKMLENNDVAFDVLISSCGEQGNTAAILLSAGFKPQTEPHLKGMLSCIRASQMGDLLEKARIFVPKGRSMMGCFDELGVLENGQCFIQVSTPSPQNCFLKHGSKFSPTKNTEVITGIVAIAKNPCLHPGDIRILEAVDVPYLHHLVDCLVFPQKGERPHTNEASGSDLDGDQYFVTWEENLIPPSKESWQPMDYDSVEAKKLHRPVNRQDIIDFFMESMVTAQLGKICSAHVVHADLSKDGARDAKCIKLAKLAATAVDFPKTGKLVSMPHSLKPKIYPDFMGKDENMSYKSEKILGRLYRQIIDAPDEEMEANSELAPEDIPFDPDLEIPGFAGFIKDAWNQKCTYDAHLSALLAQYRVNREEEVVTGHIWSMPKSKNQFELKERLNGAYNALRKEFRCVFENVDESFQNLTVDEKNAVYEQKASAWYRVTYHPEWVMKAQELKDPEVHGNTPAMLSFAWIAADYMARIKIKSRKDNIDVDTSKPINALLSYIADRV
ncbi:RNA-dependent RNA polymerase 6-like isoform X1 [Telopea speciosissima]|uniref:RNA-dependent RNA polymerase 6-like isoform X1 n=1 Tax=Telopea speciosissima TaxID=54955 RepID=UPI001CC7146E|nr:RNA-dependent RNA polymerase 6-like isoform X1 [Telopea speciosissima]XP_043719154.1 RNA-dependent RNA polymerase 6-like isoform X1 [Telopea speciosissima]